MGATLTHILFTMEVMTDTTELLEARTRRIAADVASLVQRATTADLRLTRVEDALVRQTRMLSDIQATMGSDFNVLQNQISDIAASVRLIARAMDVHIATDPDT